MTGEFHYREKWPKELRLTIENEDELNYLKLVFNESIASSLKRFKEVEIKDAINKGKDWKKRVSSESQQSDYGEAYCTAYVWEAIDDEFRNMTILEDASHI